MATPDEYVKDNDYTLSVTRTREKTLENSTYPLKAVSAITNTFNFLSQQVTTTTRDYIYQTGEYKYGGSSGVSVTTTIQNFDALQSPGEIAYIHQKLTALDGHPPALEDIVKNDGVFAKAKLPKPAGGL